MSQAPTPKAKTSKAKKEALQAHLPSKVSIFGKEIAVVVTTLKGLHGDYDGETQTIRIHSNASVAGAKSTLFHEAVHAALHISGQREMLTEQQEEGLVQMMEQAFHDCVDINKLALDK